MTTTSPMTEIIRAGEELDAATVSALRTRIAVLADQGCRTVVVDLRATRRIDSCGLAVLAAAHRRLRGHGGTLAIAAASGTVTRALRAFGLDRVLHVRATVEDAAATTASTLGACR
jgi:anti-sigma B factor antagonist